VAAAMLLHVAAVQLLQCCRCVAMMLLSPSDVAAVLLCVAAVSAMLLLCF